MDDDQTDEAFDAIVAGRPTRWTMFLTGEIKLDDWDDDELAKGYLKGHDSKFHGRGPTNIPVAVHKEIQRRLQLRGAARFQGHGFDAVDRIAEIMNSATDQRLQFDAAKFIVERVYGKAAERVELTVDQKPWEALIAPTGGIFRRVEPEEAPVPTEQKEIEP